MKYSVPEKIEHAISGEVLPTESPIEQLARELHWKMEHLDPSDAHEWECLSDHQKDFYMTCVEWILFHRELVMSALKFSNDNAILGSVATTEKPDVDNDIGNAIGVQK